MRKISAILESFLQFPQIDIDGLLRGRRPLILAPHPDDESLGCGGLIAAATDAGLAPVVAILTDGAASHPGSRRYPPKRLRALREQEVTHAASALGLPLRNLHFLRAPDTQLPAGGQKFDRNIERLAAIARIHGCGVLLAPWRGDPHCDHEAAAIMAEALSVRTGWAILSYPVWGWLRAGDERFEEPRQEGFKLEISSVLPRKQNAIAAHQSQYGALIQDSPDGFKLPQNLLEIFARPFEVYIA
jgi:LmbE family N-acetylglucosaminyl deacetylase